MIALLAFIVCSPIAAPDETAGRAGNVEASADFATDLDSILSAVVSPGGLVRYDLLRGPLNPLFRSVLQYVEEFDASRLSNPEEKLAFWMNAYNVQMLESILEVSPLQDILAEGFAEYFFRTPFRTARISMTLDQLEHVILRRQEGPPSLETLQLKRTDPRIHVGINCGALSCPRLRSHAFRAATVDSALEAAMRDFVNSTRHFRLEDGVWTFSSILEWFGEDFDISGPAGDFLSSYVSDSRPNADALRQILAGRTSAELRQDPRIRFAYDWTLNAADRP